MQQNCPLCNHSKGLEAVEGPLDRHYFHCPECDLIFVVSTDLLSVDEERKRYVLHENDINDPGYVGFLSQAVEPALPFLDSGMEGLDFGSGPGPALSMLLREKGLHCQDYDPVFGPSLPDGSFDFIFSTEAFEHFHDPVKEMNLIDERLNPGGYLIVMSMWHHGPGNFRNWFYARDDTHVLFFSLKTFLFIASQWQYELILDDGKRVVIFRKKDR